MKPLSAFTEHIRLHGRVPFDENGALHLWWSFSGFSFRFCGTGFSLSVAFSDEQPAHLAFIIDGRTHKREMNGEETFTFALKDGEHTVYVRRASNRAGSPAVQLTAFAVNGTLLSPPEEKQMKIEFIGDSITCGYGILGAPSPRYLSKEEDATLNYAAQVTAHFDAEARYESISGHGIVHNCDGGVSALIPTFFLQTGKTACTASWDFADGFTPDVVVINAGTNDVGGKTTEREMRKAATAFIKTVRAHYHDANIIWTYGLMNTEFIPTFEKCVKRIRLTDKKVWFLPTTSVWEHKGETGANTHPGILGHRRFAKELIAFIEEIL